MSLSYFLWRYFLFYPEDTASHWQDGYQEMVKKLNQQQNDFDKIIVSTHYGQPHIFVAFFTPIEPKLYQEMVKGQNPIFNSRVAALGKIQFREIKSKDFCLANTLVITGDSRVSSKIPRLEQVFITNRFHQPQLVFEMFDTNEPLVRKEMCVENEN